MAWPPEDGLHGPRACLRDLARRRHQCVHAKAAPPRERRRDNVRRLGHITMAHRGSVRVWWDAALPDRQHDRQSRAATRCTWGTCRADTLTGASTVLSHAPRAGDFCPRSGCSNERMSRRTLDFRDYRQLPTTATDICTQPTSSDDASASYTVHGRGSMITALSSAATGEIVASPPLRMSQDTRATSPLSECRRLDRDPFSRSRAAKSPMWLSIGTEFERARKRSVSTGRG